jgi:hypothetical protein
MSGTNTPMGHTVMTSRLATLGLLAILGCSKTSLITSSQDDQESFVSGQLTLTVSDFSTNAGMLWIAPTAEGARGAVTARAIRYGSLCGFEVTGRAEVAGNRIALHVDYMPRLTLCTAEIRALRYDATIDGLAPGRYEVHILHSEGKSAGEIEVRVQSVDVT